MFKEYFYNSTKKVINITIIVLLFNTLKNNYHRYTLLYYNYHVAFLLFNFLALRYFF